MIIYAHSIAEADLYLESAPHSDLAKQTFPISIYTARLKTILTSTFAKIEQPIPTDDSLRQ